MSSNPVYSFFATPGSLAPFLIRLALTAIYVYHGGREAFGWFGGAGWHHTIEVQTSAAGMNLPYLVAAAGIVVEIGVCLFLFLGFLTRLAGLAVAVLAGVTLISMTQGSTFDAMQFYILVITCGFALTLIGGGALSVDRGISNTLLPEVG